MAIGIVICVIFVIMAAAMMSKKLPAILALPIMAIVIAVAAGMPLVATEGESIFQTVMVDGTSRLIVNAINVIFAAWFSSILYKAGITNLMIKKAAELGGDKPVVITLLVVAISAFIFSGMGGVGAVAMVGGTALPIMMAVGATPIAAAHLFMAAVSAGYSVQPGNVVAITNLVGGGVVPADIQTILWILCACDLIFAVVYAILFFKKTGKKYAFAAPAEESKDEDVPPADQIRGLRAVMAAITPLPLLLCVYALKWNTLVVYMFGVVWVTLWTAKGGWDKTVSRVTQSAYDACFDAAPAIMIYFGIGMVLKAVGSAYAQTALGPFVEVIVPNAKWGLILFCMILAPLCLYRGPFNVLGLGSCLAAIILSVGRFSPVLLAAIFQCTQRWPAKSCPTATQVVWVANACGEEPVKVSNKVFPIEWVVTAATIVISSFIY